MAISFFKKGKDKTPEAPVPREEEADATQLLGTFSPDNSGIVVEETGGAPESTLDEAAILFASNHPESAEALLKSTLATNDPRTWHMLFDLYRLQTREKDFEKLAIDYALRFETSPPVWKSVTSQRTADEAKAASAALPSLLDAKACANLRTELAQAPHNATIRLDFSRIEMVDEAGAGQCAEILANSQKIKHTFQVSGVDRLIQLLQDLNRAKHTRAAHWLLLLELFQLLGRKEDFEDLAVNYAVQFEVSPPSWIETSAAQVVQVPDRVSEEVRDDALALSGEISSQNEAAFALMSAYAKTHSHVVLDLAQVTRVDYASVGGLIGLLMQWLGDGKTITLRGHHTFIQELFRIMNIDQLAQLQPAKLV